jgi:hypothetical protein
MIMPVVLAVLGAWIVISAVTAAVCALVVRGGVDEDRARGFLTYDS